MSKNSKKVRDITKLYDELCREAAKHPSKLRKTLGIKHDNRKLRWDLLPIGPIKDVVRVLTHGAKKYDDDNWKHVDFPLDRYYAAALRHLSAWRLGAKTDKGSGRSHLTHAICCLLFLWCFDREKRKC